MPKPGPNLSSDDQGGPAAVDESTPLLAGGDEEAVSRKQTPTPLPKAQLGALVGVYMIIPIAHQQILPYVNQLLADFHVAEPERVGFYSGIVGSAYALAQVFSVYQWGRISDIVGRRPVVLTGLAGIAVTTTTFGLSTSFPGIVVSRFCGGLIAGNMAATQSILAEITDDTNQDLAVPIYSLGWPLGAAIGSLIGGTLENAATRYPQYFSWHVFVEHPYLPPCAATAACALVGVFFGYMLIRETLPSEQKRTHLSSTHAASQPRARTNTGLGEARPPTVMELLSIPAIRALTISGFALSFLCLAFETVFALLCYTPINADGLGLEPSTIGTAFSIAGMLTVLLRFFAMPYVFRRFDYVKTYNACMGVWPITFTLLPCLNLLARAHAPSGSTVTTPSTLVWTGLLAVLILSKIAMVSQSLGTLLIKRHVPSPSALGQSYGLVQFAMSIGCVAGPIIVSTLFTGVNGMAWVRQRGVGWMWAVGMVVSAIAGARVTRGIGSRG